MKDISDVTCAVSDTGLFVNVARTMATKCSHVIYHNPECRAYPSLQQSCIGDGFDNITVVRDIWSHLGDIDLFCYPDVGRGEEQHYLRSIGKPVWGSSRGENLELKRAGFMEVLDGIGLEVPPHHICDGLADLRSFLKGKENQYVKISRFRGDMETHHFRNMDMDEGWMDSLACQFGPLKDMIQFLVFEEIDAELEVGGDSYNVIGRWPGLMLNGWEGKDKSYIAAVTKFGDMPDQVQEVMERMAPVLKVMDYRGAWSSEIRISKDGKFYFIDPTCRGGMPSFGSQQLLWKNFAEIVWAGANGELLEPEPSAKFSMETMITSKDEDKDWACAVIPEELEGTAQFYRCCKVDGRYAFPPCEYGHRDLGWLVSTGDTPSEVLEKQKEAADLLPDGLNADVESMASVIQSIEKAQKADVPFTEQEMPEPAEVF